MARKTEPKLLSNPDYTTLDRYANDSRPIFHQQSTDIPQTIDTPHIGRVSTSTCTLAVHRLTYQSTCWPRRGRVSADMSTDMSADTPAAISVECRPTHRSTCRPAVDPDMAIESRPILGRRVDRHIGRWCRPILD